MPHNYPLMLDVSDRLVVIVGGGAVGARKARGLIECGAKRVRCVSPNFGPDIPDAVQRIEGRYEPRHLDGAILAFAVTDDPVVNAAVVRDGQKRGVLVNRGDAADNGEPGDFATPAKLVDGAVTVTVSAGGSPALAALIRDGLNARWDPRWTVMAEAMQTIRPMILAQGDLAPRRRQQIFHELATEESLALVADGGLERLRHWLLERFPELNGHG
jgi:precorrin-2 dehydrogenase/sirohydrochlorin ferrochelatase